MAEGGHHAIVVRTAPFAKEVGQTVHIDRSPRPLPIGKHRFLGGPLTPAVGVFPFCLNGAGQHHRYRPLLGQKQIQQFLGKAPVAGIEFLWILGPVYPRQVKDKPGSGHILPKPGRGIRDIVAKDLPPGVLLHEPLHQVFAHKAPGARYQNGVVHFKFSNTSCI